MYIFLYITLLLLFLYGVLINYYERSWKTIPDFRNDDLPAEGIKISVIIPARNEQQNITRCLESIQKQTYPSSLFEVIVIDDHSTDDTALQVRQFPMGNLKLVQLIDVLHGKQINSYKKKAIETGITLSSGALIVTTDADCVVHPKWLQTLAAFHSVKNAGFIAAPVMITPGKRMLSVFQALDFITLQGITAASVQNRFHNMCNGANLAYLKNIFYDVEGFKGIDNIASGDDMLLMQKVSARHPQRIFFLKSNSAIVTTDAAKTWRDFLNQRIRWASKAGSYKDPKISSVLLLVYLVNLFILVFFFAGFFNPVWLLFFLMLTIIKTLLEISFTKRVAKFFNATSLLIYFPLLQPVHMMYIVIAGWLGLFGSYRWKERKVK
jgi:cellulose synthase/poly-beta-1,6-N-acetylglucosamine synthase-like glycosyltransferase